MTETIMLNEAITIIKIAIVFFSLIWIIADIFVKLSKDRTVVNLIIEVVLAILSMILFLLDNASNNIYKYLAILLLSIALIDFLWLICYLIENAKMKSTEKNQ
jgi:hypothetical protein